MNNSLEKRFRDIRFKIEGFSEKRGYMNTHMLPLDERLGVVQINKWHSRIIGEIDYCLQMKKYNNLDVAEPVGNALLVLEKAYEKDGVLTDSACEEAEKCLLPLEKYAKEYTMIMAGHAHLDMNWKWSWDETVAIVLATFRTMLRLMEEYPQFKFSQSQASVYKIVEDYAPEMMEEIKKRIKEGRWEITASAWVETDKNMPSVESLQNHIVYTKKYMKEHWDIDPDSIELDFSPDTFGHSANIPELNSLGGLKYYYHCRGREGTERILYRWKAPSGKEVLIYREPYWYSSGIVRQAIVGLPRVSSLCAGLKTGLIVYGVGDHGGGPTRRDLNRGLEMQEWPVYPNLVFGSIRDYFKAAESVRDKLEVIDDELNCVWTGCYTTQSRIKKGNRRSEIALLNAEKLSAIAKTKYDMFYPEKSFENGWRNVLFTHFHDIITGSCTQDTREHAMGLYQEALSIANSRATHVIERIAEDIDTSAICEVEDYVSRSEGAGVGFGVTEGDLYTAKSNGGLVRIYHAFNTTNVDRYENVKLSLFDWPGNLNYLEAVDVEGNPLPMQMLDADWEYYWAHRYVRLLVTVKVPANGYSTFVIHEKTPDNVTENTYYAKYFEQQHLPFKDFVLENDYISAKFDCRTGEMYSYVDKKTGEELLKDGERAGLRLIKAQTNNMSAWVIGHWLSPKLLNEPETLTAIGGKLNSGFVAEYKVMNSKVKAEITLGSQDKYLQVKLNIDWREFSEGDDYIPFLTYTIPVKNTTGRMLCDVPAGVVWREDGELDTPCQRYMAAELQNTRVLALASDSKYGFRLSRGELSVSLINSSKEPDLYPERGVHDIKLFIMPSVADAKVLSDEMDKCMNPLLAVTNTSHKGNLPTDYSFINLSSDSVVFTGTAIRDNKLSFRMYESKGADSLATVTVEKDIKSAVITDLFGNDLGIKTEIKGNTVSFTMKPYTQAELRID